MFGNFFLGIMVYGTIKFFGYWLAAVMLNREFQGQRPHLAPDPSPWTLATVRLLYGALGGGALLVAAPVISVLYFPALVGFRVAAWKLALKHALERNTPTTGQLVLLTAWSFVLDVPAIVGLVTLGDFWVC